MTRRRREHIFAGSVGVLVAVSLVLLALPAAADDHFALEFFIGTAVNFKTPQLSELAR